VGKLITPTFLVVGLSVGFLAGMLVASRLRPDQIADSKTLVAILAGAIFTAILFRWFAAAVRDRTPERYWPALGSAGLACAIVSLAILLGNIK
jgi:uncharacterized protein YacL